LWDHASPRQAHKRNASRHIWSAGERREAPRPARAFEGLLQGFAAARRT